MGLNLSFWKVLTHFFLCLNLTLAQRNYYRLNFWLCDYNNAYSDDNIHISTIDSYGRYSDIIKSDIERMDRGDLSYYQFRVDDWEFPDDIQG